MLKSILLFFVILAVSVAIGVGIFHIIQPSGQAGFNNFGNAPRFGGGDFGGERSFGSFNLIGGLFGMTGNIMVVAFITFVIVSVRNIFSKPSELAKSNE